MVRFCVLRAVDAAPDQRHVELACAMVVYSRATSSSVLPRSAAAVLGAAQLLERVDGRVDDVVRVRRADALGQDVVDARDLEHRRARRRRR